MQRQSTTASPGNIIIAIGGALALLSFFLPWFSYSGLASFSGLDIVRLSSAVSGSQNESIYFLLVVIPLMGLALLGIGGAALAGRMTKTRMPAFIVAAIGLVDLLYFVFVKFSTPGASFFSYAGIGFWLTLLGLIGGLVGGFLAQA
jgi:hypothetical protein